MNLVEKIQIRDGVFLQVHDGQASIHSFNTENDFLFQINLEDEARAREILQKVCFGIVECIMSTKA